MEERLRSAFPGQSEDFYKYGKWGGGATSSDAFLKLENIEPDKIKVSEMGKYFDVLRIICHTEKKEEMESHQNR